MKKLIIIIGVSLLAFKADKPKTLKAELTTEQWNIVLEVINQSNAPHLEVEAVKQMLIPQLQKQEDSTKIKK